MRAPPNTGATGALIVVGLHVVPRLTETIVAQIAARLIVRGEPASVTRGALDHANVPGQSAGGWRRGSLRVRAGDRLGKMLARRG